ncbi:translation factor GTPase family protein [Nonomuraea longicatena]|uniref:TetM/TetW/TetO/TetS family tetracycline resistance ribosomal protection protein n=1 Tax=Nonomuraea longicatena TaxID=83682 RepID=A0ABN1PRL9_9ACTN
MSRTLNLGILAHVDAGKTSLTERLLHTAGVIGELGSVDDGSTQTDSLELERSRGITIRSAVVAFDLGRVSVNLIDTPGHPDFISEVERVLNVLDGAVLVVSAVEGVQAQTRVLMRTLRRLRIPTLIFVNKIDRAGADLARVMDEISARLTPSVVAMGAGDGLGTREADFTPYGPGDPAFAAALAEVLADHDDTVLADYVEGAAQPPERLSAALAEQVGRARVHPVLAGSAITGAGVPGLVAALEELLPASRGEADGPLSATVFKVERGPAGERVAYARVFTGTLRVRDRVGDGERVTAISVFERGSALRRASAPAGRIAQVRGLSAIRVGDSIGQPPPARAARHFAPPSLETVVVPRRAADRAALHTALTQLAEQDPLIDVRQDDLRREISVSLYGEVQKEVIGATLAADHGLAVDFRESTVICVERPAGSGAAVEIMGGGGNPFLATVGLRVDPAPVGSGISFRLEVELGSMPYAFMKVVEETVRESLGQGLSGWEVADCAVTLTHTGYAPRQSHSHQGFDKSMSSTGADFRGLTPLVLMEALRRAGTVVLEPAHRFRLEVPADTLGALLPVLTGLGGIPLSTVVEGAVCVQEGEIPAASLHALEQSLPPVTRGEGMLEAAFSRYRPVRGPVPSRPRTDHNPLDRREYLLQVLRRVSV